MTLNENTKHRIYVAARFALKESVAIMVGHLERLGHTVVSDWHLEIHPPTVKVQDLPPHENCALATKDLAQVRDATALVFLSEHPDTATVRGGRHVEFGIALERGIPILVLSPTGDPENVFHYIPSQVQHFDSWVDLTYALNNTPLPKAG